MFKYQINSYLIFGIIIILLLLMGTVLYYYCNRFGKCRTKPTQIKQLSCINNYCDTEKQLIETGHRDIYLSNYHTYIKLIADEVKRNRDHINRDDTAYIDFIVDRNPFSPEVEQVQQHINDLININMNYRRLAAFGNTTNLKKDKPANGSNCSSSVEPTLITKVDQYFKDVKVITSDTQNVHEPNVTADLTKTYQLMLDQMTIPHKSNDEIKQEIYNKLQSQQLQQLQQSQSIDIDRVKCVIDDILHGDLRTYSIGYGSPVNMRDVLRAVWMRTYEPGNVDRCDDMQNAILVAINDCYENGYRVCGGGIAARLLASLNLIDYDDRIGNVMTTQQYKSEIMGNGNTILKEVICDITNNTNNTYSTDIINVAKSYSDTSIDDSQLLNEAKSQFYSIVEKRVDDMLLKYGKATKPEYKAEIMAGIIV